jgi:hypothetical protein
LGTPTRLMPFPDPSIKEVNGRPLGRVIVAELSGFRELRKYDLIVTFSSFNKKPRTQNVLDLDCHRHPHSDLNKLQRSLLKKTK